MATDFKHGRWWFSTLVIVRWFSSHVFLYEIIWVEKMKLIFDEGLVSATYDSLPYEWPSDFCHRAFMKLFEVGACHTISQLMSRLGALRESDFDMHIQQYNERDKLNLLAIKDTERNNLWRPSRGIDTCVFIQWSNWIIAGCLESTIRIDISIRIKATFASISTIQDRICIE